ncbi:B3 domain-containing protein VP1 isoform X2 [Typha angustifolia]|uniref:B3 domain-containing protein VP1 isoform X2 n=1 Tax=Typha angustifolia TaxID=59011 RepID=UPI003C30C1FD
MEEETKQQQQAHHHLHRGGGGGGGGGEGGRERELAGDPADDIEMISDIDGEDFIFSDDAFSSLPDFRCLSSPSATPPSASKACPTSSSSSSSSSTSWPFLRVPKGGNSDLPSYSDAAEMMTSVPGPTHVAAAELEGLDILGDIDFFDLSDAWDPSSLFPDENMMIGDGGADQPFDRIASQRDLVGQSLGGDEGDGHSGRRDEEEDALMMMDGPCEDLAKFFLEWLKNNKDSISPEDLRSIRLKRSTIECAARRLGGGKQGRMQLLKLILAWVQNHHLQKKRRRCRGGGGGGASQFSYYPQSSTFLLPDATANHNPNPSLDYNNCSADSTSLAVGLDSWVPYPVDPTKMGTDSVYQGGAAPSPYAYQHNCTGSSVIVNNQPFSPATDLHAVDPAAVAWPQQFAPSQALYPPFPGASTSAPLAPLPFPGGYPNQYPSSHLYHSQGQRIVSLPSATKEARKKRMARQRRLSSLHQHRNLNHNHHHQQNTLPTAPLPCDDSNGAASSTQSRNWTFWSTLSSQSHQVKMMADVLPPSSSNSSHAKQLMPPPASVPHHHQQQQSSQRNALTTLERRQGLKAEKNLRFLLQKVLKQSDVGSLGRIVLPKEAEIHLPELDARDGISIPMEDIGTSRVWNMRYRFWPNNKSRMYLLENTGDFVRSNGLQEGDFIVIYSDVKSGKYMIRGVKVRQPQEPRGITGRNGARAAKRVSSDKNRGSTVAGQEGGGNGYDDIGKGKHLHSWGGGGDASVSMAKIEVSP